MEISDVFMKVYKQNWIHIKVSNRLPPSRQQNKMFCVCIYILRGHSKRVIYLNQTILQITNLEDKYFFIKNS